MKKFTARNGATLKPIVAGGLRITYSNGVTYPLPAYALSALRQYFREEFYDEHPDLRPKLWLKATPGEVWDVDLPSGGIRAVTVHSVRHVEPITVFRDPHTQVEVELEDVSIRDARRVWPGGQP